MMYRMAVIFARTFVNFESSALNWSVNASRSPMNNIESYLVHTEQHKILEQRTSNSVSMCHTFKMSQHHENYPECAAVFLYGLHILHRPQGFCLRSAHACQVECFGLAIGWSRWATKSTAVSIHHVWPLRTLNSSLLTFIQLTQKWTQTTILHIVRQLKSPFAQWHWAQSITRIVREISLQCLHCLVKLRVFSLEAHLFHCYRAWTK